MLGGRAKLASCVKRLVGARVPHFIRNEKRADDRDRKHPNVEPVVERIVSNPQAHELAVLQVLGDLQCSDGIDIVGGKHELFERRLDDTFRDNLTDTLKERE